MPVSLQPTRSLSPPADAKKRVAIVGSGLAGLTAAHYLQAGGWEVELFEKNSSVGMDIGSLTVGDQFRVDVPFRVFTPSYYPTLCQMYENLGLSFSAADYSLSFSHDGQPVWSYTNQAMDKQGALLIPVPDGSCLDGDKGRAINRDWIKLGWNALCAMRWPREHFAQNTKNSMASLTVAQYLEAEGYSKEFSDLVLLPFLASLMTCSLDAAQAYPANTVMHFIGKVVFGSRLLKARNGVSAVCKALTENLPTQHMSCVVNKIEIQADHKIRVHYRNTNNGSKDCSAEFDSLVLATPADIAADIISHLSVASGMQGPSKTLLEALKSVPYEDAQVSTHTDSSVMPKDPKNWRGVNLSTHTGQTRATATHWINQVEKTATTGRQLPHQLFQTVDPPHPLRKDSIISSTSFHRSLVTRDSQQMLNQIHEEQGKGNIWFVGTYTVPGVPLLEGCVRGALDVVQAMNTSNTLPFQPPVRVRRCSRTGSRYPVGLAEGMRRGEIVEAYFEGEVDEDKQSQYYSTLILDIPQSIVQMLRSLAAAKWSQAATYAGQAACWSLWTIGMPVAVLLLTLFETVLRLVFGSQQAARLQAFILDIFIYIVCTSLLIYRRVKAVF